MLRHRKHKKPISRKGSYYIFAMGPNGFAKIKVWRTGPEAKLVYMPNYKIPDKQYINRYHVGDDGYVVLTRQEITFAVPPRILK